MTYVTGTGRPSNLSKTHRKRLVRWMARMHELLERDDRVWGIDFGSHMVVYYPKIGKVSVYSKGSEKYDVNREDRDIVEYFAEGYGQIEDF